MSIRNYFILSYLSLIVIIILGMVVVGDNILDKADERKLSIAEEGVISTAIEGIELSKNFLTTYGEKIVDAEVEEIAKLFPFLIKDKNPLNYERIRQDFVIREIATKDIVISDVILGYIFVYDMKGEIILHPNKELEGKNYLIWKESSPEMYKCVTRSFKNKKVKQYCDLVDKEKRKSKEYIVLQRVPKTNLFVAAVVSVDKFFLPGYKRMEAASKQNIDKVKQSLKESTITIGWHLKKIGLMSGVALGIISGLLGMFFAATISRPLFRLRDAVREIGEGNFAVDVPESGAREVAQLAQSFNHLGQKIEEYIAKRDFIRDTLGRYVTQEVARKLLDSKDGLKIGGETREVSILMSDLRGFTAMTADMKPEQIIIFLNRYLSKMIEVLTDHHAVIDEILGDGILAFFGAPEPLEDHPAWAVACALAMQAAMEEINRANARDGFPHLEMGIGVTTGSVVVGNIGSEKRTKYGAVGSPVNFVGRVESFAVGGQVLLGPLTYKRVEDRVEVGESLQVQMKGLPGGVNLYDVRGIGAPFHIRLKERCQTLVPLREELRVHLYRLQEKIVLEATKSAWITHLCDNAANLVLEGELQEWEDIRLHLLDEKGLEVPGTIYGKVYSVRPADQNRLEAHLRFTSLSPEIRSFLWRSAEK